MSTIPTVIFNYRVDDILEEITKRTSYTGKMRRSEQEPFLVDRLSLTRGEDFMFSEFLEEAVSETYDWVRAFGRCIPMYDKIVLKYNDVKQYKNHGYKVTISGEEIEVGKTTPIDVEEFEEQQQIPIGKFVNGKFVNVTFPEVYAEKKATDVKSTISALINSIVYYEVEDVLGNKHMEEIKQTTAIDLSSPVSSLSLPSSLLLGRTVDVELELLVTVEPQDVESIERNAYVEYHYNLDNLDVFDVYQVTVECTNDNWMDYACKQAVDPRGCVIFILERTDHMDLNLISSIDRNIKEALINYIIYKWFEYTNVEEADKFYLKFDYHGQKAQIGMNSETKIVQRKYNINH